MQWTNKEPFCLMISNTLFSLKRFRMYKANDLGSELFSICLPHESWWIIVERFEIELHLQIVFADRGIEGEISSSCMAEKRENRQWNPREYQIFHQIRSHRHWANTANILSRTNGDFRVSTLGTGKVWYWCAKALPIPRVPWLSVASNLQEK